MGVFVVVEASERAVEDVGHAAQLADEQLFEAYVGIEVVGDF